MSQGQHTCDYEWRAAVVSEEAKATLRRLAPSCIVFVPEMIEVNDAYHPDGKKLRFSFHNGRGGWAETRGVCDIVWRMLVAAEVQAFTDGPKATLVTLRCIKGLPFSPLCLHHSLFLPTTTTTLVLSHAILRYSLSSPCPPSSVQVHLIHAVRRYFHH